MIFKDSIQGGTLNFFSDHSEWTLADGVGDRSFLTRVIFDKPFMHAPFVTVSIAGIDASKESNLRIVTQAHSVTQFGFELEVRTWADSSISFVSLTWMAYEIVG